MQPAARAEPQAEGSPDYVALELYLNWRSKDLPIQRRVRAMTTPVALSIAGSDSSAGAGLQADLKTFSALGVYGATVVTAVTAQNTTGVTAVHNVPPDMIAAQIAAVFSDLSIRAVRRACWRRGGRAGRRGRA